MRGLDLRKTCPAMRTGMVLAIKMIALRLVDEHQPAAFAKGGFNGIRQTFANIRPHDDSINGEIDLLFYSDPV